MKAWHLLAASVLAATIIPTQAVAQQGTPAFRVPIGGSTQQSSGPATFAWMQNVSTCSNACGNGTRTTSYQCQNISDYDFSGGGYGAPEAESSCTSTKPSPSTTNCTNYSGCSYDWIKPAPTATIVAKPNPAGGTYPPGAVTDCSYAKRTFAPYCQRSGSPSVTMPAGDHAFCKNDLPDYADVAAGKPDALGYDRNTDSDVACVVGGRDNEWKYGAWGAWSSECSTSATRTRSAQCVRKYNGASLPDSQCAGLTKADSETQQVLTACTYKWNVGSYGSYANSCSDSATRTRTVDCRRLDGATVGDAQCSGDGPKPATSETSPVYTSCTYSWGTPSGWSAWANGCSANTTRTRTVPCVRSNGATVADSFCANAPNKPTTTENGSNYASCTYAPRDQGRTACTPQGTQQQYWDCTRSDGQTGFPASYCGKTNPENLTCTPPPPVYTYTPQYRGETACSGSQKQVYWDCTRSDGATGFPASMCGKANPETQSCVMPVTYTPRNRGETACSNSQKQVYWDCLGSDGSVAPASACGKTNPETQSCVMPVTYSPRYQGESACTNGQKQVYWDCLGSNGSSAPASTCGKTNPEIQSCTSYTWVTDGWSGYNSGCSSTATRTRGVYCRGSDGNNYPDGNCASQGPKPAASETAAVYSSCTYRSEDTGNNGCVSGTRTYTTQCRRSDGNIVANSNCGNTGTRTESCTLSCSWKVGAPANPGGAGRAAAWGYGRGGAYGTLRNWTYEETSPAGGYGLPEYYMDTPARQQMTPVCTAAINGQNRWRYALNIQDSGTAYVGSQSSMTCSCTG
jgi:hypothetical protein